MYTVGNLSQSIVIMGSLFTCYFEDMSFYENDLKDGLSVYSTICIACGELQFLVVYLSSLKFIR